MPPSAEVVRVSVPTPDGCRIVLTTQPSGEPIDDVRRRLRKILDEEVLLDVQVECEHGSEIGKVVTGETGSTEWQLDRGDGSCGVDTAVAAVVVSW